MKTKEKSAPAAVRIMECSYGGAARPSDESAPFFESRAPGSVWAKSTCARCGYAPQAHEPEVAAQAHLKGKTMHKFVEHAGEGKDRFYCGCWGWE